MARLRIDRKAYTRKRHRRESFRRKGKRIPATSVKRTKVPRTIFTIKDRGRPGRGPKILPRLRKGGLGFPLKGRSQSEINRNALRHARAVGEREAAGQLRAVQVLTKRTNPVISRKAKIAAKHVYKNIGGFRGQR